MAITPRNRGASSAKYSCKNKVDREFLRRSIESGRTIRRQPPVSTAQTAIFCATITHPQRVAGRSKRAVEPLRPYMIRVRPRYRNGYRGIGGGVPEWLNGAVSKTVERVSVPRVRISLPPPFYPWKSEGAGLRAESRKTLAAAMPKAEVLCDHKCKSEKDFSLVRRQAVASSGVRARPSSSTIVRSAMWK